MTNFTEKLQEYARIVVQIGVNIQPDQLLFINTPLECADFARMLQEEAFKQGARDVYLNWGDEKSARTRYLLGKEEIFSEFPDWQRDRQMYYATKGAAFISISSSDPDLFNGVDQNKILLSKRAAGEALIDYRQMLMNNENRWCVISIPTEKWAKKVFPESQDPTADLWESIFKAVRIGRGDAVALWQEHKLFLEKACAFLNAKAFTQLRYRNSLGTDFTLGLPKGHIWLGGAEKARDGIDFIANMPTEEVFTVPDMATATGTVHASKPLIYNGTTIKDMVLTFAEGKVVEYSAAEGVEALEALLATDSRSAYLGEVALVPYNSPISESGILFYNTLFDENASCHLAFGKAYPTCIEGGDKLTTKELLERGVNDSLTHEDFMLGTSDLEIIGTTEAGEEIVIFKDGNFACL